jgi:signal transduction histidine kinase
MRKIKSLKSLIVLQFAVVVLPMMAILLYQTISDIYHAEELERSYRFLAACHVIESRYAQFVNGVVDAVDTGQLGADALRALDEATERFRKLAQEDHARNFIKLQGEMDNALSALKHDRSLNTLILLRATINQINAELGNEYVRYEKENRQAIEANISSAKIQKKIVSSALLAVFAGLFMALLASRKILGSVRACMDFAGRIAQGDLTCRMPLEGWKEFRALAGSLSSMSEALQLSRLSEEKRASELERANEVLQTEFAEHRRAEEEVRRLNEELELIVEERTRELVDAQEELVRKEKLSILGQLSGSVGHELRNPLGVMSNAVYFLQMVLADADETTKEYLEMIKKEIDNSQRIITDLLDFARTKPPQVRAVTALDLVNESLGRCAIPDNVELRSDLPDTLPKVSVDPLQMGQVLQNLVTNAVQAMPNGGALTVAARLISECGIRNAELNAETNDSTLRIPHSAFDGNFIEISVADTGEGIAPENMKKLFQPLFTTKAKGIGLGLVVCRNLTEANGGRLTVESRQGEGTTFTVVLPVEGG